ncbi:MAG: polyprenol monophosphomannose synthase, partial [Thermoplasmata archaeon]|nr:polyprenol monophosphomannose synthase [Thermoplasmata archaeon]
MSTRPRVTVILPTYNERASLQALHPRLLAALARYDAEILVVDDDSPDGTGDYVRSLEPDGIYRLISRPGRGGLATAVRDGLDEARGEVVVVMDADGSHPPETIPELVEPVLRGEAELALASRHLPGATVAGLPLYRQVLSAGAAALALPLTRVTDPMSGFFALHPTVASRCRLAPSGFKIGLEILVKCRPRPVVEVPYHFGSRIAGTSKLGSGQILHYLGHLGRLYSWEFGLGRAVPAVTRIRVPSVTA